MKRFSLLLAMALILAVAVPAMAGPFSDVPATHWAYDALQKLSSTGIITGYPDGTFKGKKTLTRYEIAVVTARILDNVAAERAMLAEKVDALEDGLTAGQAEDVIAIFKSLMTKNAGKTEVPVAVESDHLSATQAEEVAGIVSALVMEFQFELEALNADIAALGERIDGVDAEIADLKKITWNGSYWVELDRTDIDGNGAAYLDPFVMDENDDDDIDGDDKYAESNYLGHGIDLGMAIKTDNISASFDVAAVEDNFIGEDAGTFTLEDLYAEITGDNFEAVVGRDQDGIVLAPYVLGDEDDEHNGAKLTVGNDTFVLFKDYVEQTDADDNVVKDADDNPFVVTNEIYFAMAKELGILDSTLAVGYAMGNNADGSIDVDGGDYAFNEKFVAGINTPVDLFSIDLTTDVAIEKLDDDFGYYFTVNAKKDFGPLALEGNFTETDKFTGLKADGLNDKGFDGRADLALLGEKVNANVRYENYDLDLLGFGADAAFGNLTADFDMETVSDESDEVQRMQMGVELDRDIAFLNVVAGYTYDYYENDPFAYYVDEDDVALDTFNNIYGDLSADLFVPGMTATASYVYSIDKKDVDFAEDQQLSTHEYGVAYEQGIVTADFNYDMISSGMDGSVDVDPEAYNVFGFDVDTVAGFYFEKAKDADLEKNYNFGVDVDKQLTNQLTASYGFGYDYREVVDTGVSIDAGTAVKHTAGIAYAITSDIEATVDFTNLDFDADTDANDYQVKSLTAGFGFDF